MPQKTMTVYSHDIKFTLEGSPEFVDGWVMRLKTPVERLHTHKGLQPTSSPDVSVYEIQPKETSQ